jgi:antitoxin component YwqK of YwqJK toxin-antitoxin module
LEDIIGSHHIQHKRKQRFLKTETFQSDALVDSYNISKILTNSVLNVYCNNPKAGELWKFLCRNRNNLLDRKFKNRYDAHVSIDLHSISDYMRNHRPQFQDEIDSNLYDKILGFFRVTEGIMLENNLIDEYRFDFDDKYIEIENDFSKIVKRNNYKGYAIWIDKDVSAIMDREVYEFLYIVRNDIAITKTKNDKVAIINCEHEDWKGNRLNTKSVWIIEDDFACKEVEGNSVERYEKTYKDDRQDGLRTGWYENGKKEEEGTYKDGKKDGKWTGWYENGQKKDKGTWKNGIKSGDNIQYYSNGQKYKKRTFVIFPVNEGLLDGLMTMWYENGQIMRELYYKKNQWNGRETCWYKNGQKRYEGHHIKNKKEGEWLEWNKDGSIKSKTFYKKGEIDTHGVDKKWNKLLK